MKYFTEKELSCPCCGAFFMEEKFQRQIDNSRRISGIPYIINSGCRCKDHNAEVGGSYTSSHLSGWAVDVRAELDHHKFKIVKGAIMAGITRILIYRTFLHLDSHPDKKQEIIKIME